MEGMRGLQRSHCLGLLTPAFPVLIPSLQEALGPGLGGTCHLSVGFLGAVLALLERPHLGVGHSQEGHCILELPVAPAWLPDPTAPLDNSGLSGADQEEGVCV